MTYFYHAGGGGLPEDHPAYEMRHNLDDEAFRVALLGELLHVIAPRQVGKTSLLKRLSSRLRAEGWRCVTVDLSTLLSLPMKTWYTELGNKLAEELTPGSSPTLTNHLQMSAYLTGEALRWAQGRPNIAVFFDEVESATKVHDEQDRPFSDAFFMTIRDLYQKRDTRQGLLTIGLAGGASPTYLVKESRISPFNVGQTLDIDDFTKQETRAFTDHLTKLHVEVEDTVHDIIYTWTYGHPYLTHRICSELEKRVYTQKLIVLTPDDVTQVVNHTFLQPSNPQLEDGNIRHAKKMLHHLPDTVRPLWERLQQGTILSRRSVDTETLMDLYITGVVKILDERIVIRNHIYEEVFVSKAIPEPTPQVGQASQSSHALGQADHVIGASNEPRPAYDPPAVFTLPQSGQGFLAGRERDRIIEIIETAIDGMERDEIKNILDTCHIPKNAVNTINFAVGSHSIANQLERKLEHWGALHPTYQRHALGAFLAYIAEKELVGFDAALELVILIFKYRLILNEQKVRHLSSYFQIPLPVFADTNRKLTLSPLPTRIQNALPPSQIREHLESLYNKGVRHYNSPDFFLAGNRAINAVCRIEFDAVGEGTGFLVAPDLVLTNYHVFKPYGTSYNIDHRAKHCQARFKAKRNEKGEEEPGKLFKLHASWLVSSSEIHQLDYLLMRLAQPAVDGMIAPVTFLPDADAIHKDMFVNIIHHPGGKEMVVSLRYNEVVAVEPKRIYYLADTEDASSGAPVFDDSWRVVALHRSGGERDASGQLLVAANAGVPIGLILEQIRGDLAKIGQNLPSM